jgi:tryptophan halogenase|tara:strand:+ start:225 stop:1787 length:1563 start_codon:yes stop_codon:yes gene_type:complete
MSSAIRNIVIIGGGSAGWLSAGIIAATYASAADGVGLRVTLIESPDIKTIGVGEGTWPSMRRTLKRIGLSETDFLRFCDASFKQGTEFHGWASDTGASYTHPFMPPTDFDALNPVEAYLAEYTKSRFDQTVCPQVALFADNLAPKQITTPEYAGSTNYGYHLDAGKFAALLQKHCTEQLGVTQVVANVTAVLCKPNGDIDRLKTDRTDDLNGDLFIDCSGTHGLLINGLYNIGFIDRADTLFNNRAIAAQTPYVDETDPIASCTHSTAQSAGWIWDIGLPTRRGTGYVFSTQHQSDDEAERTLRQYIERTSTAAIAASVQTRAIAFEPGHREIFWHRNCVALGMAAGFIEPLEASALVLVELGATMIADELPADRSDMDRVSKRYNDRFQYRWDQIIDFLKLHYVLSTRTEPYWVDHRHPRSIPESLTSLLQTWAYRPPWHHEGYHKDEMFPSASYQYVLYGMGFRPARTMPQHRHHDQQMASARRTFAEVTKQATRLRTHMPSNRALLETLKQHRLQTV